MRLMLDSTAPAIKSSEHTLTVRNPASRERTLAYDALMVGTGAVPVRPLIEGLDRLGPADGVHVLHSMSDTLDLDASLNTIGPRSALIVGAGYVGMEMTEGLTARGLVVTQVERLPEVHPTVDPELGALVHAELDRNGIDAHTRTTVTRVQCADNGSDRVHVDGIGPDSQPMGWDVDLVLVVVGVRPDTDLLVRAGAATGVRGVVVVDESMATGLPRVWAAGDCVTLLSGRPSHHHPGHRRPGHRPAARRRVGRPTGHRDRQASRHLRHRAVPHHDRRRHHRPRPFLHPALRVTLGRRPSRQPGIGP
jgi:pyruvate/2-oxoglutarate dehydrogenase complex dihydrolipoamide dehydrogenase (E3) component